MYAISSNVCYYLGLLCILQLREEHRHQVHKNSRLYTIL